jgi:cell division transport system permease protein
MRANFVLSGIGTGIRRNLTMTIALVLSTSIALAFVGAAILANTEITRFQTDYEGRLNVSVFLCPKTAPRPAPCASATTPAQTEALRQQFQNDPHVSSVSYVSEQEQFRRAQQILPPEQVKGLTVGTLPASFTVKLKDIKRDYGAFAKKYGSAPGVSGVQNDIKTIRKLLDVIDGARLFAILIAAVVLVASILLIANTIQVAAAQRKNETSIMRLVGASRWMTELPFMLETIIATVIGAVLAAGMVYFGKHYVLNNVFQVQVEARVIPNLDTNDVLVACGVGALGGIVLAGLTAFLTLRLYVKL